MWEILQNETKIGGPVKKVVYVNQKPLQQPLEPFGEAYSAELKNAWLGTMQLW